MSNDRTKEIMNRLENLRSEEPVLWAIVQGATTELKIGIMTGLPPKRVMAELAELKAQRVVNHYMRKAWLLNKKSSRYGSLAEAAKLAGLIEQRWVSDSSPEAVLEIIGMLSAPVRARFKADEKTVEVVEQAKAEKAMTLTDRQQEVWDIISGWLEDQGRAGEPFTTREAAKAQGFDKPGFTKSQLVALVKKGKIRHLPGRPEKWVLLD